MGVLNSFIKNWKTSSEKKEEIVKNSEQWKLEECFGLDKEIENDFESMQKRIEISKLLFMEKYQAAQKKLEHLKKDVYKKEGINYQYIIFTEAIIKHSLGQISDEAYYIELLKAIHLSKPTYKITKRMKGILTRQETLIIISLALFYKQKGDKDTALKILYQLEDYYKKNMINFEQNTASLVWHNLSQLLNEMGKYEEGQRVAEEGIKLELKHTKEYFSKDLFYLDDIGGQVEYIIKQQKLIC